jgi:hypothetical protein
MVPSESLSQRWGGVGAFSNLAGEQNLSRSISALQNHPEVHKAGEAFTLRHNLTTPAAAEMVTAPIFKHWVRFTT